MTRILSNNKRKKKREIEMPDDNEKVEEMMEGRDSHQEGTLGY
jgi:hypothetical protein